MRRIILCCTMAIVGAFSAQAEPSDPSKRLASGSAKAVDRGQDFADGLFGPDFWEVTGVSMGDALNMRRAPSPHSALVLRLPNGATLRNLGCKISNGARWCRVEQPGDPAVRGWVNGRYLSEAAGQN